MDSNLLKIAVSSYYYKPMAAFMSAFTLNAYSKLDITLSDDSLDMGCSDGTFDDMLMTMLQTNMKIVGLDYSFRSIYSAKKQFNNNYQLLLTGDGTRLPFVDENFSIVISNMVLAIIPNTNATLAEVSRVLKSKGRFVCTFRTETFRENYVVANLLERVHLKRFAETYRARLDRRTGAVHVDRTIDEWKMMFEAAGFGVDDVIGVFPNKLVGTWSLLTLHILRVFGVLRLLSIKPLSVLSSQLQYRTFNKVFNKYKDDDDLSSTSFVLFSLIKE